MQSAGLTIRAQLCGGRGLWPIRRLVALVKVVLIVVTEVKIVIIATYLLFFVCIE